MGSQAVLEFIKNPAETTLAKNAHVDQRQHGSGRAKLPSPVGKIARQSAFNGAAEVELL